MEIVTIFTVIQGFTVLVNEVLAVRTKYHSLSPKLSHFRSDISICIIFSSLDVLCLNSVKKLSNLINLQEEKHNHQYKVILQILDSHLVNKKFRPDNAAGKKCKS